MIDFSDVIYTVCYNIYVANADPSMTTRELTALPLSPLHQAHMWWTIPMPRSCGMQNKVVIYIFSQQMRVTH